MAYGKPLVLVMPAFSACVQSTSNEWGGPMEAPYVWDASNLTRPKLEAGPRTPGVCRLAIECRAGIGRDAKVACAVLVESEGELIYDGIAGVERRGRSSGSFPKANYSMELRHEDASNNPVDLLGMGRDEDWQLDGSWADRSFMRNQLVAEVFRQLGAQRYAPEARFCSLQLNGEPTGLYRLVERPKRDKSRIDIPEDDGSGRSFVIRQDAAGLLSFPLGLQDRWETLYPKADRATGDQLVGIQDWLDGLNAMLWATDLELRERVFDYLDAEDLADWVLLQEFSKNVDAYKLSVHIYKAPGEQARLVPWDFDLAFGQPTVESVDADSPEGWVFERTPFARRLFEAPRLQELLGLRWRAHREGPLSESALLARVDEIATLIGPELEENFARWPLEDVDFTKIWGEYSLYDVDSYDDERLKLREWIRARLRWMDENIDTLTSAQR